MALEMILKHLECGDCGKEVSIDSLWLDNSGPLCRDCVVERRHALMGRAGMTANGAQGKEPAKRKSPAPFSGEPRRG